MRRLMGLAAAVVAVAALLAAPAQAAMAAPGGCPEGQRWNPDTSTCIVVIVVPPDDGGGDPGGGGGGGGGSAEPACVGPLAPNFCSGDDGWTWSEGRNCYMRAYSPQPPEGELPEDWHPPIRIEGTPQPGVEGAWYRCAPPSCVRTPTPGLPIPGMPTRICGYPVWLEGAPPTISPDEAAQRVFAALTVRAFDIGMAPRVNPEWGHRRTHVGVPVWMWVADRGPQTYDGYTVTQEAGGLTVSGSMRVSSIEWRMGDGSTVVCGSAGQPYQAAFGWRESPDCGHVYSQTSAHLPGDRYPVEATTRWVFEWRAGGATGTIETSTVSTTEVEVNELQTVNTSPRG